MTTEHTLPDWQKLTIVGTTTPVQRALLPQRLEPVYQSVEEAEYVWLPLPSAQSLSTLSREPLSWFEELCAEGSAQRFNPALPAMAWHVLLQLEPDQAPEQLLAKDVPERLERFVLSLFQRLENSLSKGPLSKGPLSKEQLEDALELAARAFAAANTRDAAPALLQLALAREVLCLEDVEWLERELLVAYTPNRLEESFRRFSLKAKHSFLAVRTLMEEELTRQVSPASSPASSVSRMPSASGASSRSNNTREPSYFQKLGSSSTSSIRLATFARS